MCSVFQVPLLETFAMGTTHESIASRRRLVGDERFKSCFCVSLLSDTISSPLLLVAVHDKFLVNKTHYYMIISMGIPPSLLESLCYLSLPFRFL
jgi:hypothetical protein